MSERGSKWVQATGMAPREIRVHRPDHFKASNEIYIEIRETVGNSLLNIIVPADEFAEAILREYEE